jgi:hypothetical protein
VVIDNNLELEWCLKLIDDFNQIDSNRSLSLLAPNFAIVQSVTKIGAWDVTNKGSVANLPQNLISSLSQLNYAAKE